LYFFKWEYYDAKFERRPKEGEERFHVLTIGLMSEY
jgi:hypothetical protein